MIKITTLGDFDISINDTSIMDDIGNKQRLIKLFKYFLIHKDTKVLPERIIEDLWIDEDFKDPINMLRTQISRLRKIIEIDRPNLESFFSIKYVNGYYVFSLEDNCEVDFIEFENILERNTVQIRQYIIESPLKFKNIILSYKGKLYAEIGEEDWLVPIRSRFERLYVKGVSCYIEYLNEKSMYNDIIEICEEAINIKPYEEVIHLGFMEALVNLNQHSYALVHYEFFTKKLSNDLGIAPSKQLLDMYRRIQSNEDTTNVRIDLNKIDGEMVKEFDFGGVVFCDVENFKFLYNYEKRNKERRIDKDIGVGIGVVTIYSTGYSQLTEEEIKKGMDLLGYIFFKSLRRGDVVAKWNDNQMLMLLYGLREEYIKVVVDRIHHNFNEAKENKSISLNIKLNVL